MARILTLAFLMFLACGIAPAFAACAGYLRILDNQTGDRTMTVRAGKQCSVRLFRSAGPLFGAEIVARPRHGRAFVEPPHRIVYAARGNFTTGQLHLRTQGLDPLNKPVTYTVRVAVTVVP